MRKILSVLASLLIATGFSVVIAVVFWMGAPAVLKPGPHLFDWGGQYERDRETVAQSPADIYYLGWRYYYGEGVEQNFKEAFKWFKKAAAQGDADAQLHLGFCYMDGEGVAANEKKAAAWFRKAAAQGNADAQSNLGWCYYERVGVKRDVAEALGWLQKAAEQGDEYAVEMIGEIRAEENR